MIIKNRIDNYSCFVRDHILEKESPYNELNSPHNIIRIKAVSIK